MVGVQGFEPWTPWSQTRCATRLRYTPNNLVEIRGFEPRTQACKASVFPTIPYPRLSWPYWCIYIVYIYIQRTRIIDISDI